MRFITFGRLQAAADLTSPVPATQPSEKKVIAEPAAEKKPEDDATRSLYVTDANIRAGVGLPDNRWTPGVSQRLRATASRGSVEAARFEYFPPKFEYFPPKKDLHQGRDEAHRVSYTCELSAL